MAKDKAANVADALMKPEETKALMLKSLSDESFILDGAVILEGVLTGKDETAKLEKVVKLVGTPENMNPGITGIFQGYEPVLVRRPGAGPDEPKQLMNFVLLEVRSGFIGKLLGSSQVMQGLGSTAIGTTVSIIRPHVKNSDGKIVPEYTDIGGARRVGIFHVINRGTRTGGSATPYGEMGKQLAEMNAAKALPAGKNDVSEIVDGQTGEIHATRS